MEHLKRISYIIYGISGAIGYAIGGHDLSFKFLMGAMALDTLFGTLKAIRFGEWNSSDAMWGSISKLLMLLILGFFNIMSNNGYNMDNRVSRGISGLLLFLTWAEMVSVIQNYIMIRTGEKIEERDAVTEIWNFVLNKIRITLQSLKDNGNK